MYNFRKAGKSLIIVNTQKAAGETIERKVERMVSNKEPIKDGAPLEYTERNQGVQAGHNIRTDRFEVAADTMDKIIASKEAQRESKMAIVRDKKEEAEDTEKTEDGGAESVGGQ